MTKESFYFINGVLLIFLSGMIAASINKIFYFADKPYEISIYVPLAIFILGAYSSYKAISIKRNNNEQPLRTN